MEMQTIYVQLLDEGTKVYRPVPAIKIQDDVYELQGAELYDKEDEIWEFGPNSRVFVKEDCLGGEKVLIAYELCSLSLFR